MEKIIIFDTTLRDGEQAVGGSLNVKEKLEIAKALVSLGVNVIEAGFPITSKGDFEAVKAIGEGIKDATVCGLARAAAKDVDRAWEALKCAHDPRIHVFVPASSIQMQYQMNKTPDEVLEVAKEAVKHAKKFISHGNHTTRVDHTIIDLIHGEAIVMETPLHTYNTYIYSQVQSGKVSSKYVQIY